MLSCNGLKSIAKKSAFRPLLDVHEPDIVLGCEFKVDSTIPTYNIFPDTYEVLRKDKTLTRGGVFIAMRNDLAVVHEHRLDADQCETITVPISNCYRPPSSDTKARLKRRILMRRVQFIFESTQICFVRHAFKTSNKIV